MSKKVKASSVTKTYILAQLKCYGYKFDPDIYGVKRKELESLSKVYPSCIY